MLKRFAVLLAVIACLVVFFLFKDKISNNSNNSNTSSNRDLSTKPDRPDAHSAQSDVTADASGKETDIQQMVKENSQPKESDVITQVIRVRGKLESDSANSGRGWVAFSIVTSDKKGSLNFGSMSADQQGGFTAEYSYKKPAQRQDEFVISWYVNGAIDDNGEIKSGGNLIRVNERDMARSRYISATFTKNFDIVKNPMEIDTILSTPQMAELILKTNFVDGEPAQQLSMNIVAKIGDYDVTTGQFNGEALINYSLGSVKSGTYKLKLPPNLKFTVHGSIYGAAYTGWSAEVELAEGESRYLEVNVKKSEGDFIGVCLNEIGAPLKNAHVIAYQEGRWINSTSRQDGSFQMDLDKNKVVNQFTASGNGLYAYYQDINAADLVKIILRKSKQYKIYFEIEDDFKTKLSANRAKILCITETAPKGMQIYAYNDPKQNKYHTTNYSFTSGKKKFQFLVFDEVALEWIKKYDEAVEFSEATPQEITIKMQ
ncbi:MAG: hypothetical protein HY606_04430 [Planctomycetes bacterium]|nr:hypothetical protein [Planctomycetota bacterium]